MDRSVPDRSIRRSDQARWGNQEACHNLPRPLTSFIGREREVAEAGRLLGSTRLLTLIGPVGVGKTRLGYQIAAGLLEPSVLAEPGSSAGARFALRPAKEPELSDGVWLVELATLADPGLVPQAVATVLRVREQPERSLTASLVQALRPVRLLLVLDNCEHLTDACAEVADALLRACPGLRILATSRQPLGVAGETTFPVPPLATSSTNPTPAGAHPGDGDETSIAIGTAATGQTDESCQADALRLFVERAQAVTSTFALTDRNLAAVETICRRLDGLPLAIELAAARVAVLSPEQIAARLGDRFRLLSGGSRTALPRYRTLRALIDWSHDLLDDQERILLRRLAVFSGGWTLEAVEAVCSEDGLARDEILDVLSRLVEKSLAVTGRHDEEMRYRFLETLREYAAERLRDADEATILRRRHLDWFLALAERAEPELTGPRQVTWLRQLDQEHDNMRAALAWAGACGEVERGLRLAGALYRYWATRGYFSEGHRCLAELLQRMETPAASASAGEIRARALRAASRLAAKHGDHGAAHDFLAEALAIARAHGDRPGLAAGAHSLGCLARVRGDYEAARAHLREAHELLQEQGDTHGVAETLVCLGVVAYSEGDLGAARSRYDESLTVYRAMGDRQGLAMSLNNLGEVALEQGDLTTARSLEQESLALASEIGDRERVAIVLAALGGVAAAQRQPVRAMRLAAAAMSLREAMSKSSPAAWRARFERWLEPARRALSEAAARAAWAEGDGMSMAQAVEYARAVEPQTAALPLVEVPRRDAPAARARPRLAASGPVQRVPSSMTQRELEVAMLIARGLTNRQIAAELVITEGTAANHVKHILARLGLDSRLQIAAWMLEHGLYRHLAAVPSS